MIILLLRDNSVHISNYKLQSGHRTMCYQLVKKSEIMNTLGADNSFPQMCRSCKVHYDNMKKEDLELDIILAHNKYYFKYFSLVTMHRNNYIGPIAKHYDEVPARSWKKLYKYKSLLARKK